MKRLLPGVLLAAFVLDARATDSLQNGCGLDYTRVRPAFLVNPRGEGNRIFADDHWDVCVPLGQCNFVYNGITDGIFFLLLSRVPRFKAR
jgi:hypothetical protein